MLQFLDASSVTLLRLFHDDSGSWRVASCAAVSKEQGRLVPASTDGSSKLPLLSDTPAHQECVDRSDMVQYVGTDGHFMTLFPVQGERVIAGILEINATSPISSRDAAMVQGVLSIVRNHLALLDYGEVDTLTGLLNRKTFESHFAKLHDRLTRAGEDAETRHPSWLALMDIDKFKSINDSHGHLFGDEVLLLVSQIMKRTFRRTDQLFRFGGEEFVIVLDCATGKDADFAFERLRIGIESYRFPQLDRVTVSQGCTQIRLQDTPITCVERADAALYFAKNHGRNAVRNYETLIAAGDLIAKSETGGDAEFF